MSGKIIDIGTQFEDPVNSAGPITACMEHGFNALFAQIEKKSLIVWEAERFIMFIGYELGVGGWVCTPNNIGSGFPHESMAILLGRALRYIPGAGVQDRVSV